jgi:glutathione synthase/RimK-type ligase-like ATP-grasp enzyme
MKNFYVFDDKKYPKYCEVTWHQALLREAQRRGFNAQRITHARQITRSPVREPSYLFVRLPMRQPELNEQRATVRKMAAVPGIRIIQDMQQINLYEDKLAQTAAFSKWMPKTRVLVTQDSARDALDFMTYPFISKSSVGASSQNVRLLESYETACQEIRLAFTTRGIPTSRGFKDQRGYLIWQEFIPHTLTYRVNVIGQQFAIFKRFCYADRPMAQTGNVEPVMEMSTQMASLLLFAGCVTQDIGTRWCALDILESPDGWKLLETSIGWPWPSPGECNKGTFFFSTHLWIDMFKVLFDEIEVGVWG